MIIYLMLIWFPNGKNIFGKYVSVDPQMHPFRFCDENVGRQPFEYWL